MPDGPGGGSRARAALMPEGLRLAVTLLTVLPLRAGRVDKESARLAMTLAPLIGLVVGGAAALVMIAGEPLGIGPLPRAALAVAAMALITRALHLDGLADLADGLGSARPAAEALEIMKRSDIGPFGVVTLLLALLIQVTALAESPQGAYAVIVAAVAGRLALPWACRTGIPAARPGGLGALVAGTVPALHAAVVTAVVLLVAMAAGALLEGARGIALGGLAIALGLGTALLMLRHATRRLGGITGDVLGALTEISATTALVTLAIG